MNGCYVGKFLTVLKPKRQKMTRSRAVEIVCPSGQKFGPLSEERIEFNCRHIDDLFSGFRERDLLLVL